MKELAKRKDLIISSANKDGAVCIMDTRKYNKEADRQAINTQDQHYNIIEWLIKQQKDSKMKI